MKLCPNCKTELDDHARFCLSCMTALDEKEQITPPVRKARRWLPVLLCGLAVGILLAFIVFINRPDEAVKPSGAQLETVKPTELQQETEAAPTTPVQTHNSADSCIVDGVRYTFRPATREDYPEAINLENYYALIRVEGTPSNGIYRVPSFVGDDTTALVTVIADGAFAGTDARIIDLGYNVRRVWGNAFGGCALTDLYLHIDVLIEQEAFSGCTKNFTIHSLEFVENTKGILWSELAVSYGFRWQFEEF